jgi:SAM-dependent methyltransferase
MSVSIIGLHEWFQTPAGAYLLDWERCQINAAVADIFGYHALQLGVPSLDAFETNRIPHQWLSTQCFDTPMAHDRRSVSLVSEFSALPFPSSSLDLVVLPHSLEFSADPHATLREVERVLVPEGRVVICGFNPTSLWGMQQSRARLYQRFGLGQLLLPDSGDFIGYWRLRDWLRLLSFEVECGNFGCYRPGVRSEKWLLRFDWMDTLGPKWWPIFGAAYFLVAVKRVRGMRLLGPAWKAKAARVGRPVSLARREQDSVILEKND